MQLGRAGSTWIPGLAVGLALGALAFALHRQSPELLGRPGSSAVDLFPLWCRARGLLGDALACEAAGAGAAMGSRPGVAPAAASGAYYYPPTAALLGVPLALLDFGQAALLFRAISVAALGGMGLLLAVSAPVRSRPWGVAAGIGLGAVFLSLRITRGSLLAGQTGPLLAFGTAAVLLAAARHRDRLSGALAAVAIGFKLLPVAFVPAFLRRGRWLAALVSALVALFALAMLLPGARVSWDWIAGAFEFSQRSIRPEWKQQEPPWVLVAWSWRTVGLGVPTLLLLLFSLVRPAGRAAEVAAAFVVVAWVGTVMAGSQQTHEAVVLLPAVGWALVWPAQRGPRGWRWVLAGALAAKMVWLGVGVPRGPPNTLAWIPLGYLAWIIAVVRWGWERKQPA